MKYTTAEPHLVKQGSILKGKQTFRIFLVLAINERRMTVQHIGTNKIYKDLSIINMSDFYNVLEE
jgi:hypothetical protein